MTSRPAIFLLSLFLTGASQMATASEPVFPRGSHIGLVPPAGMTASNTFSGFEDRERKAAILLSQVPAQAYDQFLKSMSEGAINVPGVSNAKRELMLTEGGAAHLVVGDQEAEGVKFRKWLMITRRAITNEKTDMSFAFVVTAQVPEAASEVYSEEIIRKALGTVALRVAIPQAEILELMPFKLTDLARFEGVRLLAAGRAIMLTEHDGPGEPAQDDAVLMISVGAGAPSQPDERATFSQNVLRTIQGFSNLRLLSSESMRIGRQPGHEIRLDGLSADNVDVVIVQWIRFSGSGSFLRIVGVTPKAKWVDNLARFRAVRDGVDAR